MHICLIAVEIFAWGKYGGFGRATRLVGRELARREFQVSAVVPRRKGQRAVEDLDGIRVYGFRPYDLFGAYRFLQQVNADIYHSQEPSLSTYLARKAQPSKKHVVTFRDTHNPKDWFMELRLPSLNPAQVLANWVYEDNSFVTKAVQQADRQYAAARLLIPKAREKYGLTRDPIFLPTPVEIPQVTEKASRPTVCFMSRWDKRKRPELFFELTREFPEVQFIAAGKSRNSDWEKTIRQKYRSMSNLQMLGFVDQFKDPEYERIMNESWIMVNTSTREGLPNSVIEAAAHRCALLSIVDPDGFASNFGFHVQEQDFTQGLRYLLENDNWRKLGQKGFEYVSNVFALDKAMDQHIQAYQELI